MATVKKISEVRAEVLKYRKSGLTVVAYCKSKGLNVKRFYGYTRRLRNKALMQRKNEQDLLLLK
jgi:hypothetical protein